MWSTVLVLALLAALNPARLGLALLVISRPRPVPNLVTYWLGCLAGCFWAVLVPLTVFHGTPMFKSFANALAATSTIGHIRIGMGVLALSIAALITVRSLMHRRQHAYLSTAAGDMSPAVGSNTPAAITRLLDRAQAPPTEGGSMIRRLLVRVYNAWENGSLWVALAIGFFLGGPEPEVALFLLTSIVTSGAATGTQVSAAVAYAIVMLAIVEIILVSYLAAPKKTQAMVQRLHDWARTHRQKILVTVCAVGGVALVATGMAIV